MAQGQEAGSPLRSKSTEKEPHWPKVKMMIHECKHDGDGGWRWGSGVTSTSWNDVCVCCGGFLLRRRRCWSSELTRCSLVGLQQSNDGRIALGTLNELLQRQSTCKEGKNEAEKVSGQHLKKSRCAESWVMSPLMSTEKLLTIRLGLSHQNKTKIHW